MLAGRRHHRVRMRNMNFTDEKLDWALLQSFLAVAEAGSLGAAARVTGTSAATLHRRIAALEGALGRELVSRSVRGYHLTEAGMSVLEHARRADGALAPLYEVPGAGRTGQIRLSAGPWTSAELARHAPNIAASAGVDRLELITSETMSDLTRRQADLGIRNVRPTQLGLAARKLKPVPFAFFATKSIAESWSEQSADDIARKARLVVYHPGGTTASARWLAERIAPERAYMADHALSALALARAGCGAILLPEALGDGEQGLLRIAEAPQAVTQDRWLVVADARRGEPALRAAMKAIAAVL